MKIHLVNVSCAAKGNSARCTADPAKVTCSLCRQFLAAHRPKVETTDAPAAAPARGASYNARNYPL